MICKSKGSRELAIGGAWATTADGWKSRGLTEVSETWKALGWYFSTILSAIWAKTCKSSSLLTARIALTWAGNCSKKMDFMMSLLQPNSFKFLNWVRRKDGLPDVKDSPLRSWRRRVSAEIEKEVVILSLIRVYKLGARGRIDMISLIQAKTSGLRHSITVSALVSSAVIWATLNEDSTWRNQRFGSFGKNHYLR